MTEESKTTFLPLEFVSEEEQLSDNFDSDDVDEAAPPETADVEAVVLVVPLVSEEGGEAMV